MERLIEVLDHDASIRDQGPGTRDR